MNITCLGTGSAFTLRNYQTNFLLTSIERKRLLIDCGSDARHALNELHLSYKDIDTVYISHLHGDHCGGLEWLGFSTFFDPKCKKPTLYISQQLKDKLWSEVLRGGMSSVQSRILSLDDYFEVISIEPNGSFDWEGATFTPVQTAHIMDGFVIVPSFGLMVEHNGKRTFFTTDTQHCPSQITDFYNMSDLIIHDCETTSFCSGVHANFDNELSTLPSKIKSKMFLVHYQDNVLANWDVWKKKAEQAGFRGFLAKGQVYALPGTVD